MSCSGGGRQALMQASRFPKDYDGLVAGAPAARMTDLVMAMIWTLQAQMPPGAALRPEQAVFFQPGAEARRAFGGGPGSQQDQQGDITGRHGGFLWMRDQVARPDSESHHGARWA